MTVVIMQPLHKGYRRRLYKTDFEEKDWAFYIPLLSLKDRGNKRLRRCTKRRGARVVESGGLENRCALIRTEGSNPSLSAVKKQSSHQGEVAFWLLGGMRTRQRVRTAAYAAMIDLLVNPVGARSGSFESIPPSPQKEKPQQNTGAFFVSIRPHLQRGGMRTRQRVRTMAEPLRQHAIALLPRPCQGEMRSIESIPPSPQKEKPQQNTGAFFVSIRPHLQRGGMRTRQRVRTMAEPLRQHAIALLPRPCQGEMRSIESIPPSPQKEKPQ